MESFLIIESFEDMRKAYRGIVYSYKKIAKQAR